MSNSVIESPHGTRFIFSLNPGLLVWEKSTTPPGMDGGEANDVTTHYNEEVKTKAPRVLVDFTNPSCTVSYATAALPQLIAMLNKNQLITQQYRDGSSWTFWGWVKSFTPGAHDADGDQPTAEMEIVISNRNASGVETKPAYAATGGLPTTTSTSVTTTTAP